MHAASRHGTPSLTSLPKDDEVSCEVRPQTFKMFEVNAIEFLFSYCVKYFVRISSYSNFIISF